MNSFEAKKAEMLTKKFYFVDCNCPGVVWFGTLADMGSMREEGGNPCSLTKDENPFVLWDDDSRYYWDVKDFATGEYLQRQAEVPERLRGAQVGEEVPEPQPIEVLKQELRYKREYISHLEKIIGALELGYSMTPMEAEIFEEIIEDIKANSEQEDQDVWDAVHEWDEREG